MLKKVLRATASGCTSIKEISEKTGMQQSAVKEALRELTLKGYLRTEYGECPRSMPACRNCPISKEQPNLGANLCITEKGMRYIKKG